MPRTVIIVEDEPACRDEIARLVESWGFEVLHVDNTDQAIRAVEDDRVCMVLLDPMTHDADHASLVYEAGGKPIVVLPIALRVAPPSFRIERFLVAPESLERIVRRHCTDDEPAETTA